jgi:hypothetical protein
MNKLVKYNINIRTFAPVFIRRANILSKTQTRTGIKSISISYNMAIADDQINVTASHNEAGIYCTLCAPSRSFMQADILANSKGDFRI